MRLIDADALVEHVKDLPTWWADAGGYYGQPMKYPDGMFDVDDVVNSIESAPTVDAEPVKHGRWVPFRLGDMTTVFECSECKRRECVGCDKDKATGRVKELYPYCHCGAKMDGGSDERHGAKKEGTREADGRGGLP